MKTVTERPNMTEPEFMPEPTPPKVKITLAVKYNGRRFAWKATDKGCAGCVFFSPKTEVCRRPRGFAECVIAGISGIFKRENVNDSGH